MQTTRQAPVQCPECGKEWKGKEADIAEVCCTFVFSDDPARCCMCPCEECSREIPEEEREW